MFIEYVIPDKSQYFLGDTVNLDIRLINSSIKDQSYELTIVVYKLQLVIYKEIYSGYATSINKFIDIKVELNYKEWQIGGYGIEVYLNKGKNITQCYSTALDFTTNGIYQPRMTLCSDKDRDYFSSRKISKLHISNILINSIKKDTPLQKHYIHDKNVLLYLVKNLDRDWKDYYFRRKNWRVYGNNIKTSFLLDYYIGSNERKNQWILKSLFKTIYTFKEYIDGIVVNVEGIDIDEFIQDKNILSYIKKIDFKLSFKRNYRWPIKDYDNEYEDILLITVKQPFCTYYQIKNIVLEGKYFSHYKPVVIDMAFNNNTLQNLNHIGLKLLLASIFSNGGHYLLQYNQIDKMYECDIEQYFNFIIRYKDILYNDQLSEATKNYYNLKEDYNCFTNFEHSTVALSNNVWILIKENIEVIYISLINIMGNSNNWNEKKSSVKFVKELKFNIPFSGEIYNVYTASPDQESGRTKMLDYDINEHLNKKVVSFKLDLLKYWSIIVINKKG